MGERDTAAWVLRYARRVAGPWCGPHARAMRLGTSSSWAVIASGVALFVASCDRGPPLQRSCEGRYVDTCDPYEYADAISATFGPTELSPGDPRQAASVHVELGTCGASTPFPPTVQIAAVLGGPGGTLPFDASGADAGGTGDDTRVYQLVSVRAAETTSTSIDVTIDNPLDGRIPANTDLTLRFTPVIGDCEGTPVSIPYRTGARPSL